MRPVALLKACLSVRTCCMSNHPLIRREEHSLRTIIVSERVTLDGFVAGPQGELEWMEAFFDEALASYESELQQRVDTMLFGRVIYQGFASYWPQVARDPAAPQGLVEYAERLNVMRKLVFSKTLSKAMVKRSLSALLS